MPLGGETKKPELKSHKKAWRHRLGMEEGVYEMHFVQGKEGHLLVSRCAASRDKHHKELAASVSFMKLKKSENPNHWLTERYSCGHREVLAQEKEMTYGHSSFIFKQDQRMASTCSDDARGCSET